MEFLAAISFSSSDEILSSYQHLAALGAGALFVLEGVLLGFLVFLKK